MSQIWRETKTKVIESKDSQTQRTQTTNLESVSQIRLKRFRTNVPGTLFHKMNNGLTTI